MKTIILIPARLASTRLPNKPLADICGKSMILRVYEQAVEAGVGDVVVACSEEEVKQEIEANGGKAVMTDPNLPSGTDRIHAALEQLGNDDYDFVVNVQGDVPDIDPKIIKDTLEALQDSFEADITTAAIKINNEADKANPNVVKIATAFADGEDVAEAHYFSRATIPYGEGDLYEHIGLYVYRRSTLERFVNLEPSILEKRESLEQLRAIENDIRIFVRLFNERLKPVSVDTEDDLAVIREKLK